MPAPPITVESPRLVLVSRTRQDTLDAIDAMSPEDRASLAPEWLTLIQSAAESDPWCHGFAIRSKDRHTPVGQCGFKGPPDRSGAVEIAYAIFPDHQGKGLATEAAQALVAFAFQDPLVQKVIAHTLPTGNASARVLKKCGFAFAGEFADPIDGLTHRYELSRTAQNSPGQLR